MLNKPLTCLLGVYYNQLANEMKARVSKEVLHVDRSITLPELRKQKGNISQRDLAKALGVTPGAVALWETGHRTPRLPMVREIARYFGLESSDDISFGRRDDEKRSHSSHATNTA